MPVDVRVPSVGESVVEATILRWHKQEGDQVAAGDALAELETDKVTVDVNAETAGVLQTIVKGEGATVTIGETIAVINEAAVAAVPQSVPVTPTARTDSSAPAETPRAPAGSDGDHLRVTPLARKLAEQLGVDPSQVEASGPGGRVTRTDVAAHAGTATVARTSPSSTLSGLMPGPPKIEAYSQVGEREEIVPLSRRRRTIAQRLVEAKSVTAMLTTFNEVDMSAVMELRKRRRDAFKDQHGVSLGFMSFFTRAAIGALKAYPRLNSEIRGDNLIVKKHYDVGIAVDSEEGLVVPVVRDADRLSFAQIEQTIADLAQRARSGKLSIVDLQGGTFTITNGGVFGSLFSTPLLNMPQAAILGMHRIQERPVVIDGQIVVRPMMYLALTYDHRIVDGREAVQFLTRVREFVQDPELLLIEA
ncbi:MAG: 2-oxoglutarate dehydrogenase complex dihydrolipoyllysine-residue succinyltransferase [Chloroflexi bacterium]|nr:2-oxoglutarate dehydrogenase complex dihydrolipoyllysine-residue succinyltransferase [Chloroflexota bacterium]